MSRRQHGDRAGENPPKSIAQRRQMRRAGRFLGREAVVDEIRGILREPTPVYNILNIWGIGGIGKSQLLKEIERRLPSDGLIPLFSSLETAPTPEAILTEWRQSVPSSFIGSFKGYDDQSDKYMKTKDKLQRAATALADGLSKAIENSGPLASFVTGAVGEDRIHSWIGRNISSDELREYESGEVELTNQLLEGLQSARLRPVFILDTFEIAVPEVDEWIHGSFLSNALFDEAWAVIVAGQDCLLDLSPRWRRDWQELLWHHELQPLSSKTAEEFLDGAGIPQSETTRLADLSRGLPWALQLIVETDAGAATKPPHRAGRMTPEHAIVHRILSQVQQDDDLLRLIEAASVLESFDLDLITETSGIDDQRVLHRLRRYSFVRTLPNGRYSLHDIVRRTLASLIKVEQPDRWHTYQTRAADIHERRLARLQRYTVEWFETFRALLSARLDIEPAAAHSMLRLLPIRLSPSMAQPVSNLLMAVTRERPDFANDPGMLTLRAQIELIRNDPAKAVNIFARAIECSTHTTDRSLAWLGSIEALHRLGSIDRALSMALQVLSENANLDTRVRALLHVRIAEMCGVIGDLARSLDAASKAEKLLESISDAESRAHISLLLSYVHIFRADFAAARKSIRIAISSAEQLDDRHELAHANSTCAWLSVLTGEYDRSWHYAEKALTKFTASTDAYGTGLVALSRADLLRRVGDFDRALAWNRYAKKMMIRCGSPLYAAIADTQSAWCLVDMNRLDKAKTLLESTLQVEELIGERLTLGWIHLLLANAYAGTSIRHREHLARAVEHLNKGGYYGMHQARLIAYVEAPVAQLDGLYSLVQDAQDSEYYDLAAHAALRLAEKIVRSEGSASIDDLTKLIALAISSALRHHVGFALMIERRAILLLNELPLNVKQVVSEQVFSRFDPTGCRRDELISDPLRSRLRRIHRTSPVESLWLKKEVDLL